VAFRSTKGSVGTSPSIVFLCKDTGPVEGFFGDAPGKSVKENESGVERRKKRVDAMAIAVFSMIVSNIGIIVMIWLGAK